jgi:hypothetical protein
MARSKFRSQATANSNAIELFGRKKEPEQNLWIAVIAKALDDALYQNDLREAQIAIVWVQGCSKNFKYVCHLAGYDWQYVYQKVIKKVNQRDQEIKDYIKGIRDLQTTGLQKKWHMIRFSRLSVIKGGRAKGTPRKGGKHGRKWTYIVHPSKAN